MWVQGGQGAGCRVQGAGVRVSGLVLRFQGPGAGSAGVAPKKMRPKTAPTMSKVRSVEGLGYAN